jgi:hypothetical protein
LPLIVDAFHWRLRAPHTALVEIVRDHARRLARDVIGENLANDLGFFLDDLQLTGIANRHRRMITRMPVLGEETIAQLSGSESGRTIRYVLELALIRRKLEIRGSDFGGGQSGPVYPQLRKWPGAAQTAAKGHQATWQVLVGL